MSNQPNVVYILADDMGYGDVSCYNDKSKIHTSNIDRLATEGIKFTDAHAPSAVCTPSRYGILTGRYCWRSRLKKGVLAPYDRALIEPGRLTLPQLYKRHGYNTFCVGKWHLGWDWQTHNGKTVVGELKKGKEKYKDFEKQIDFSRPILGGPVSRGFDSYFGVDVPNYPPYTWFVNEHVDPLPNKEDCFLDMPKEMMELRSGIGIEGWKLEDVSEKLMDKVDEIIEESGENPFFIYYALTGPHTPIVPKQEYIGRSNAGIYGDYVCMMDEAVGRVLKALEKKGIIDNTIVVFTCDNGPEKYAYERARIYDHYSMSYLRGVKRDLWEGGHRVPMLMRWPNRIKPLSVCNETISLLDFFETSADILKDNLLIGEAEDSLSFISALDGGCPDKTRRKGIVYHSCSGKLSIRVDNMVYIDAPCGGDNLEPDWIKKERGYVYDNAPYELYDLSTDISQRRNLCDEYPELVKSMRMLLHRYIDNNYSVERGGNNEQ